MEYGVVFTPAITTGERSICSGGEPVAVC